MIEDAVAEFRGTYLQQPPVFSAKKIDGDRAYDLARRNAPVRLRAGPGDGDSARGHRMARHRRCACVSCARPATTCARSPTRIGERLGTGGHLAGLVRTRSGDFTLADAVGLDVLDRQPRRGGGAGHSARGAAAVAAGHHADAGRAPRWRPAAGSSARRMSTGHRSLPEARPCAVSCTPTGTWSPSPSRAPAGFAGLFASGRRTGIKLLVWD